MAVSTNISNIGSGFSRVPINTNFQNIQASLEDALSRTGVGPNQMETDLDMNSNDILNVNQIDTTVLLVEGVPFVPGDVSAIGPPGDDATVTVGTVNTGAAGTNVIITNSGTANDAILNFTIPRGDQGASGAGTGDMLAAQNLNDVVNKVTAFTNIKQAATASATGVVELATNTEIGTGTDTTRAVTPAGLASILSLAGRGMIYGLTMSNAIVDAVNDITIVSGVAIDDTNTNFMELSSPITKRLDAAWAVGTGNGGRDTGSIADNTWHIWLIKRPDTGVVDVLFSLSATSPTMPSNYTLKRRIGSVMRIASTIKPFVQLGDKFIWVTPTSDFDSNVGAASATTVTTGVPKGIVLDAVLNFSLSIGASGSFCHALISALFQTDVVPDSTNFTVYTYDADSNGGTDSTAINVITNTSGQVRVRGSKTCQCIVRTVGWIDTRGRLD